MLLIRPQRYFEKKSILIRKQSEKSSTLLLLLQKQKVNNWQVQLRRCNNLEVADQKQKEEKSVYWDK